MKKLFSYFILISYPNYLFSYYINIYLKNLKKQFYLFQPDLLSSHRNFVMKVDAISVQSDSSSRGDNVTFFVFSDRTEVLRLTINPAATHVNFCIFDLNQYDLNVYQSILLESNSINIIRM